LYSLRHLFPFGKPAKPCQIEGGKDRPLSLLRVVYDGESNIDRRCAADHSDFKVAEHNLLLQDMCKVRSRSNIHGRGGRAASTNHIAARVNHAKVGIDAVLGKQLGEKDGASNGTFAAYDGKLGKRKEKLVCCADQFELLVHGTPRQFQRLTLHGACIPLALVIAVIECQTEYRQQRQQDEQYQAGPQTGKE